MLYAGPVIGKGDTQLAAPDLKLLEALETGEADDVGMWSRWRREAAHDNSIVYFAVAFRDEVVGEIFLHDIDSGSRTGMVGYRIFDPRGRRSGAGSSALRLLIEWTASEASLDQLFGIARADNVGSCRLLEKVGFSRLAPAREDPGRVVYELLLTNKHAE